MVAVAVAAEDAAVEEAAVYLAVATRGRLEAAAAEASVAAVADNR